MPKILYIETATKTCSIGISDGGELIAKWEQTSEGYRHSEILHSEIDSLLKSIDYKVADLDAVCVSKGPGSYTGLRIAVSSSKGFCVASDLKLISVTSLESLATMAKVGQPGYDYYIPMIDARRMEVFTQVFDAEINPVSEIEAMILDENSYQEFLEKGNCLFIGDGSSKFNEVLSSSNATFKEVQPSVQGMVELANKKFANAQFEDVAYFEPFYLKEFLAGKKKIV